MINMLNCLLIIVWTASFPVKCAHGVTTLQEFYAPEGGNARFPWLSQSPFTKVYWYDGDATGDIMMEYTTSTNTLDKNSDYDIDYINETDSVGITLRDIKNKNDSALYTVKVFLTTGQTEQSDTTLNVVTDEEVQACENSKIVNINNMDVDCGGSDVQPGLVTVSPSMKCVLDGVLMVKCLQYSSDGLTSSCGNCSKLPCVLPEFNAQANSRISFIFWSDLWQGSEFNCNISLAADTTITLTITSSSTSDVLINTSTTALTAGNHTDGKDDATDHILNTMDDRLTTQSSPFVTTAENINIIDNVKDRDKTIAIWQIMLIVVVVVLFVIFLAIIIIMYVHKGDKKYCYKGHVNQRHQQQTRSNNNNTHPSDQRIKTYQNKLWFEHHTPPLAYFNQARVKQPLPDLVPHHHHSITDSEILIAEGLHSLINIRSNHSNMRYPFRNITTRYTGSYVNTNLHYEPEPDYYL